MLSLGVPSVYIYQKKFLHPGREPGRQLGQCLSAIIIRPGTRGVHGKVFMGMGIPIPRDSHKIPIGMGVVLGY